MAKYRHDRLDAGAALGELCADRVTESVRRDRWMPVGVEEARLRAGELQRVREQEVPAHRLAPPREHQLHRPPDGAVVAGGSVGCGAALDQLPQRVGSLGVQGHHPLGVRLADRDAQPGVAVGVGVEAVQREPGDLVPTGAAPAQQQDRRALVGVLDGLHGFHEPAELVTGDEAWEAQRKPWKV